MELIGTSNVAHVMCGAWRNIAALRVAFIELTIVNYLGLARAQLLIKSMPYERYSTICVARLEQGCISLVVFVLHFVVK